MTFQPSARVIADSVSPLGYRVTTIEATFHRFILAEMNTHRVFSRNSASSRAIPLSKQLSRVQELPAVPVKWAAEQPGMSGGDEIEERDSAEYFWLKARDRAVDIALNLGDLGVHKSIANRLIEPFAPHTAVVTSTAWENFRKLRVDPAAMPEMRAVAAAMMDALDDSTPKFIDYGMWHLPYIVREDITAAEEFLHENSDYGRFGKHQVTKLLVAISTARCAGTSYLLQNERRDVIKDVNLYERLCENGHASPLEHPCTPNDRVHEVEVPALGTDVTKKLTLPDYGNLLGWHQHRFDVEVLADYQAYA